MNSADTSPATEICEELPGFVIPIDLPLSFEPSPHEASCGVQFLLLDEQRERRNGHHAFVRGAKRFLTASGVAEFSQVTVEFDPAYQRVVWHRFGLHRGGLFHSQLRLDTIQTARRESRLEQLILDHQLTQIAVAAAVGIGDILEYAYSIIGELPCFEGRTALTRAIQWSVPVEQLHFRYVQPDDAPLKFKTFRTDIRPQLATANGLHELVVNVKHLGPVNWEDSLPFGYTDAPLLQLSDYDSWNSVARAVASVFSRERAQLDELVQFVRSIKARELGKKKVLQTLVDFVQREIRYLHSGGGVYSVTPHDPAKVFARRYGDCKDKSLLLVTLLELADIQAMPALVSTANAFDLPHMLPSPVCFQHAIVCAQVDDEFFWIDPTIQSQTGPLELRQFPDYRFALPVNPDASSLVPITYRPQRNELSIREKYEFHYRGDPAVVTIQTRARGESAEHIRALIEESGLRKLGKHYEEFFKRRYESAAASGELDVVDRPMENVLTLTEKYVIPSFPPLSSQWHRLLSFYPTEITSYLDVKTIAERKHPRRQAYPIHYEHEFVLESPDHDCTELLSRVKIDNPFFSYHHNAERTALGADTVVIRMSYDSKVGLIQPDQIAQYNKELQKLNERVVVGTRCFRSRAYGLMTTTGITLFWMAILIPLFILFIHLGTKYKWLE